LSTTSDAFLNSDVIVSRSLQQSIGFSNCRLKN
jgi:hypothetical protein